MVTLMITESRTPEKNYQLWVQQDKFGEYFSFRR